MKKPVSTLPQQFFKHQVFEMLLVERDALLLCLEGQACGLNFLTQGRTRFTLPIESLADGCQAVDGGLQLSLHRCQASPRIKLFFVYLVDLLLKIGFGKLDVALDLGDLFRDQRVLQPIDLTIQAVVIPFKFADGSSLACQSAFEFRVPKLGGQGCSGRVVGVGLKCFFDLAPISFSFFKCLLRGAERSFSGLDSDRILILRDLVDVELPAKRVQHEERIRRPLAQALGAKSRELLPGVLAGVYQGVRLLQT